MQVISNTTFLLLAESDGRRIIEMKFEQRESEEELPPRLRREVEESAKDESS